jgi:hypothetical protein
MNINWFKRRQPRCAPAVRRPSFAALSGVQTLEHRALLAIDSGLVASQFSATDVNRDGRVSAIDALQIVNELNRVGSYRVGAAAGQAQLMAASVPASTGSNLDVNGDGWVTSMDALRVVNQLNAQQSTVVQIRLQVTDLSDNAITSIGVGGNFKLKVFVRDMRGLGGQGGVFSAYTDVLYNAALAGVTGAVSFNAPPYSNGQTSDISTDGVIDDTGAFDGFDPLGSQELLLFTVPMVAQGPGTISFISNPAEEGDVAVYGQDNPVPATDIAYGTTQLEVLGLPAISITDVTQSEGTGGGLTNFNFTVTLSQPATQEVRVDFATAGGTAQGEVDFQSRQGQLTFAPGEVTKTISVGVFRDQVSEPNETFFVNLTNASPNSVIADSQGMGTILDDDGPPTLSIDDVTKAEGGIGSTAYVFTVSLVGQPGVPVTVSYATANGTATGGTDFQPVTGNLTFNPGQFTKTITVNVIGDELLEANETFFVNLSGAQNATISKAQGIGTITNDDVPPGLSIDSPLPISEPVSGTTPLTFTVTLSQASGLPVTVKYATQANTATTADFQPTNGTLSFAPGELTKTITVQVKADGLSESEETFFVNLSNPVNAEIIPGKGQGVGTIQDLQVEKQVRIRLTATDLLGNPLTSITGGDTFLINAFVLDLRATGENEGVFGAFLDVDFDASRIAVAGPIDFSDIYPNGNTGNIVNGQIDEVGGFDGETPLGPTERLLFSVPVKGLTAGNAIFSPNPAEGALSEVSLYGVDLPIPTAAVDYQGTLINILPSSTISISDVSEEEGDAGVKNFVFTVSLNRVDNRVVTVDFATQADTATPGVDYDDVSGTLTFAAGETSKTFSVPVHGDTLSEANERFFAKISNITSAVLAGSNQALGTILNDDPLPVISVNDSTVTEGLADAEFTINLSEASGQTVVVNYATGGGSATPGSDYEAASGQLVFAPGETTKSVTVKVNRDTIAESTETFFLNFTNVQGAELARPSATGTILDLGLGSVAGYVYGDVDGNGSRGDQEPGLAGVEITLTGTTLFGDSVSLKMDTLPGGQYRFDGLLPGIYKVRQSQPAGLEDGAESLGTAGGAITDNDEMTFTLDIGASAQNYNFGEEGVLASFLLQNVFFASSLNGRT